jgi:hypothetical protein
VLQLLQNQKIYWKKRYTVQWTKPGDESSKFFHAAATERYRINTITSLDIEEGMVATSHPEKAALLGIPVMTCSSWISHSLKKILMR